MSNNYKTMGAEVVKNQSIPTLIDIVDKFTFLIDCVLEQNEALHYQKETIYCLRSITDEIKKHMLGEYCSQKYINEQLEKLDWLTKQFSIRNDIEDGS